MTVVVMTMVMMTMTMTIDDDDGDGDDDGVDDADDGVFCSAARHLPQCGRLRLRPAQTQQVAQRRCVDLLPRCDRRLFNAAACHRFRLRGVMLRVRSLA